jgi:hypothetical protein
MKPVLLSLFILALCTACQSYPRTPNEPSSQSGIQVYGLVDVGVTSTR